MALIEVNWAPDRTEMRKFGALYLPGFLVLFGSLLFWKFGDPTLPTALCVAAGVISPISYFAPGFARPIYVVLVALTFPIGWTISHLIMGLIYYAVLTPIGLLLRLIGHDPLRRKLDPQAETYWVAHCPPPNDQRYFRQY